MVSEH